MSSFSIKTFHKGQLIFKRGQPGTKAFLIKKGGVELCILKDGKKNVLTNLIPGQILGELALISEGPRTYDAMATEFSELVIVEKQLINQFIKNSPGIVQAFINSLIAQFQRSQNQDEDEYFLTGANLLGISKVLNLIYIAHKNSTQSKASPGVKKEESDDPGVDHAEVSKKIRSIFPVSQLDIDNTIKKLSDLYYLEVTFKKSGTKTMQKFIKVKDHENFDKVVENIAQHMGNDPSYNSKEFIDIFEASKMVGSTTDLLYKKIASNEIPDNLFFFNNSGFSEFAAEKGEYFFKKAKRKRIKIEDIEDVNDLIYVDTKTLRDVFSELGFYKVAVLLNIAEEEAKKKMTSCLSGRIAKVVQEEMDSMEDIDEIEAADIEEEVIELIRLKKGV